MDDFDGRTRLSGVRIVHLDDSYFAVTNVVSTGSLELSHA